MSTAPKMRLATDAPQRPLGNRTLFSAKAIKAMKCPPGRSEIYYQDTHTKGLALRIRKSRAGETRRFYLRAHVRPDSLNEPVGDPDTMSLDVAREKVRKLWDKFHRGEPLRLKADTTPKNLGDLWTGYGSVIIPTLSAGAVHNVTALYNTHLAQHRARPLAEFTTSRVQEIHNAAMVSRVIAVKHHAMKERNAGGATAAKKAVELLSRLFKAADLPCPFNLAQIRRTQSNSRERFLTGEELGRLGGAIATASQQVRDFVWMALLTGARCSNICAMRYDELQIDAMLWVIPRGKAKAKKPIRLHLPADAIAIIQRRSLERGTEWVFPTSRPGGKHPHMVRPQNSFESICERAKLKDVRIHDLRRTLGSHAAGSNVSLAIIGKMLGHNSLKSTETYGRLADAPVRDAMRDTTSSIADALRGGK